LGIPKVPEARILEVPVLKVPRSVGTTWTPQEVPEARHLEVPVKKDQRSFGTTWDISRSPRG